MSEPALLWILGIIATIVMAFAGALFHHVGECREVRAKLAEITSMLKVVIKEVGDHETGIRGRLHGLANDLNDHERRLEALERND